MYEYSGWICRRNKVYGSGQDPSLVGFMGRKRLERREINK